MCAEPKSTKNTVKPSVFFKLLGYVGVKAAGMFGEIDH